MNGWLFVLKSIDNERFWGNNLSQPAIQQLNLVSFVLSCSTTSVRCRCQSHRHPFPVQPWMTWIRPCSSWRSRWRERAAQPPRYWSDTQDLLIFEVALQQGRNVIFIQPWQLFCVKRPRCRYSVMAASFMLVFTDWHLSSTGQFDCTRPQWLPEDIQVRKKIKLSLPST